METADIIVVGCGLSGAVLAERFASILDKKVIIIEKRNHIAGNCYDYIDENGILINEYGAHLFHTNDEEVWIYVQQFSEWRRWDHRVVGIVDNKIVPIPVNINTVNSLCGTHISSTIEMEEWLCSVQEPYFECKNSEEMALSRVGKDLYNKIFYPYTFKQWGKYPEHLDASVLARIPVRNNFDDRYFTDKYQALPVHGYTHFVNNIIKHPNITVMLNTDYFSIKNKIGNKLLLFTGPIDHYYSKMGWDTLEYRSIRFEKETLYNMNYFQINSVVNYPESHIPYTRIVEYKHFLHQSSPNTTIVKEFPCDHGEPFYPVPTKRNLSLYEKYKKLANQEKNVHFIGRLANYKYFNMDTAIRNALDYFQIHFQSI